MDLRKTVKKNPILCIMRGVPTEKCIAYAKAVMKGGVDFFEVALNTEDALEQIKILRRELGKSAIIGAGTAVTVEKARAAMDAGAEFLLSPSADEEVLAYCRKEGIPMLPGALSPSDVSLCLRYGFSTIKLFPAGDMPRGYIKSLKGPFQDTEYVAIGGVRRDNLGNFFAQGYLGVGLGSNMIPKEMIMGEEWGKAISVVAAMRESAERAIKEAEGSGERK